MSEFSTPALARSLLFVPATRPDRFTKAIASGADQVIIDLEDSVEPAAKREARDALGSWLTLEQTPIIVRVNPPGGEYGVADVEFLREFRGRRGIAAIVVPKVEESDQLDVVGAAVGPGVPLLPIVESATGLTAVLSIARARGVVRLICGDLDLALDLRADFEFDHGAIAIAAKLPIVVASRAAGLRPPVDGPHPDFTQLQHVLESTRRAQALGFRAKICIHPAQVGAVHQGFAPSRDDEERARRILTAAKRESTGAFQLDGRMVDKPVIEWAEEVLHGPTISSASKGEP